MVFMITKQSSLGSKVKVSLIFKQGLPNLNSVNITHHGQSGSRVANAHLWPSEGTMDLIKSKALGSSTPFPISSVLHFSVVCALKYEFVHKSSPEPFKTCMGTFCSDEKPYKYVGSKSHHLVLKVNCYNTSGATQEFGSTFHVWLY